MCEECITTPQLHKEINALYCRCGCLGFRRFLTTEEKIEILETYKKQLQKEKNGVEESIKELKQK